MEVDCNGLELLSRDECLRLVGTDAGRIGTTSDALPTVLQVVAAEARLTATGLETTGVDDTQCCYAAKTETWLTGPDGARWEWYVKTGDSDQFANITVSTTGGAACCAQ